MKTILITGASSGIGAACAMYFLAQGHEVGLMARSKDKLEELARNHANAHVLPADVTSEGEVDAAFEAFVAKTGRLDVLFNNAGTFGRAAYADDLSPEEFAQTLAVNVTGMFLCARAGFGQMRRQSPQGGRIINNGSISAHTPRPMSVAYTTTKHAITGLTKSLSLDGRDFDIACGQIDIGNARTDLLEGIVAGAAERPPMIEVGDVVKAVSYMAGLPPEANVQFMTVMATKMPYVGRG
ncbi:NADP-dependent 3-hydroxy acid dehydrogenase YdfG [Poseidonocella pacifica]|uniref:NADP-dependent 3-hydroxy acid dehydrogenase YdfG n=1 Tax=Poseidonocella pacifica TaxID=871651 RepID=A0A1I0YXG0_9RHOB|nr:SDR family oxidoreductase [Poseidonocella pacifica]SFB17961.1 NADP-dependent 3-hydroxy acid dehydrogenase YdfG [Poseidonocella pacifica]